MAKTGKTSAAERGRSAARATEARKQPPGLYLVATPIGNLGDISLRALEVLTGCDVIACEDTRVTRKLTERYGIATPLTPYHEHNAAEARPKLLARLARGEAVALVSDAGTPLISDPGYKLVRAAQDAGHAVTALPGASSVLTALSVAGLPTDRFFFEGFLPPKQAARQKRIAALAGIPATFGVVRERAAARGRACRSGRRTWLARSQRSAASSPSCTRKSAAAISRRWRATTRKAPRRAARSSSWWRRRKKPKRKTPISTTCCAAR